MKRCSFSPYEGDEKYCFVSYAHKDSDKVLPVLEELSKRNYRIWYDDGIAPGSEWPEYIAEHLNKSAVVIAFVSPNSIDSPNCRREVTFALSKKKPFIGIFLCETEMSPGMEMQLSAQQCIMKYQIQDEEDFYKKLCGTAIFSVCQSKIREEVDINNAAKPETESRGAIDADDMAAVERMKAATENHVCSSPVRSSAEGEKSGAESVLKEKSEKKRTEKSNKGSNSHSKTIITVACIIAAVILAVTGIIVIASGGRNKTIELSEGKINVSYSSVTVSDATVDDEVIKKLSKQKNAESITFKNCNVTGNLSSLKTIGNITSAKFFDSEISDWSFLSGFSEMTSLDIEGCNIKSEDLDGITGKVTRLSLKDCAGITGIENLKVENITYLDLSGTGISDIEILAGAKNLKELDVSDTGVSDLNPLADLTNLTCLSADNVDFTLDKPLMSLAISEIHFRNCGLENADFMENATRLKIADLKGNRLSSADWLIKSKDTLNELYIGGNAFDDAWCDGLGKFTGLVTLDVEGLEITDLSFMKELTGVTALYAGGCAITDVSGIGGSTALTYLDLSGNKISDMDLSGLTSIKKLDLRNNKLTTAENIPAVKFDALLLCGNSIPTNTLPSGISGGYFALDYTEISEGDTLTESTYTKLLLTGCPADKQLDVTGLTKYRAMYVDISFIDRNISEYGMSMYEWK